MVIGLRIMLRTILAAVVIVVAATTWRSLNELETVEALVTFIVPSKGRTSLCRTLTSLFTQMRRNFRVIVMFDGNVRSDLVASCPDYDTRFSFLSMGEKIGRANEAGLIRNRAVALAASPWVAFVDD
jgi:hypothetical protein